MIDIDKLVKLIRLANNNSNEHEANLAARRACKMLLTEKGEFVFRVKPQQQSEQQYRAAGTKTWSNQESFWTSRPPSWSKAPPGYHNPYAKGKWYDDPPIIVDNEDFMSEVFGGKYTTKNEAEPKLQTDPKTGERKYSDVKRILTCTKCNKDIETGFVGPSQVFVCTPCQWKGTL